MFSFLRDAGDAPLEKHPKLKAHAVTVFVMVSHLDLSRRHPRLRRHCRSAVLCTHVSILI